MTTTTFNGFKISLDSTTASGEDVWRVHIAIRKGNFTFFCSSSHWKAELLCEWLKLQPFEAIESFYYCCPFPHKHHLSVARDLIGKLDRPMEIQQFERFATACVQGQTRAIAREGVA